MKWIAIMVIVMFGGMFAGLAFNDYHESQCRIEAIKAGIEVDKINRACGVK